MGPIISLLCITGMVMMAFAVGPSDVKAASDLVVEFADPAWDRGRDVRRVRLSRPAGGLRLGSQTSFDRAPEQRLVVGQQRPPTEAIK